ncbi:MAG TPA: SulP family inorganic anion transporter, partial [Rhodocyclaceae bacterium]
MALPLAMAFAIASGAKPEQGLYTAIIAGFLVSALGGSRLQIAGPTGAFIVVLAAITAKFGYDGLLIATLMAGVILVLLGVARMGVIIRYIPRPVIVGFTAGIGVIIFVGQWSYFLGIAPATATHFHEKFGQLISHAAGFHPITTALGLLSLLLVLWSQRIPGLERVP